MRGLLVDLDGVIRRWDPALTEAVEREHGLPSGAIAQAAFAPDLLEPAITGAVVDDAWRAGVAERLAPACGAAAARSAVAAWARPAGAVDEETLALVRAARGRARVGLVTNATTRLRDDLARLGLDGAFDAVVNSAEVGARKPDAAFFAAAVEALGTPAAETLFVDDTPGHVDAARALGLRTHRFAGAAGLRRALQEAGLLA